ncbi:MAG: type II secretion system protein GspG [Ketobacter sp.]|nr:type II secretion system protein GspG [Ketobacter sp.]
MYTKQRVASCTLMGIALLVAACGNDAAKAELARDHVRKLNKASEFFYIEKKKCPLSANDLGKLFTGKEDNDFDFSKDPWGNDFVMYQVDNGDVCHFKSLGADGKEGGEGLAADIVVQTRTDS